MNRNDIITSVNNLFDELTTLRLRNEYLEDKLKTQKQDSINNNLNSIDENTKKIIAYGKKQLLYDALYSGNYVRVSMDEETHELNISSFNKWVENKLSRSSIPDNMSKEDLINILFDELQEQYEKERTESIAKFEEKESKGSE